MLQIRISSFLGVGVAEGIGIVRPNDPKDKKRTIQIPIPIPKKPGDREEMERGFSSK